MDKTADSFPGVVVSLNAKGSSNKYLSANISVLLIAALCGGNFYTLNTNKHP